MKTKATTTAEKFADIMLKKMEEMKTEKWEIPWFSDTNKINFYPQNYTGRKYESGNAFFLLLCCTWENYTTPIFLTFNQCRKVGVCVKKKEHAFPIYYRNWIAYHKETKEKLNLEEYNKLTDTEKEKYRLISYVNYYNVFNLDQTNFSEKQPEKWSVFVERFNKKEELKIDNAFDCPQMDNMLNNDAWVCSINLRKQNKAYYSPSSDVIVSPLKEQFPNQHLFYSVLLHEMTHSTGTKERLNRAMGKVFGDDEYAHDYPNLFIIPTCMSNIAVGERFKIQLFMIIISVFSRVCLIYLDNQKGLWSLWDSSISYRHFGQRGPPAWQEPDASALSI